MGFHCPDRRLVITDGSMGEAETMSTPEIEYDVVIENGQDDAIVINWGQTPGWVKQYRDHLDSARAIGLVPKGPGKLPVIRVELGPGKRWVIFSRVAGRVLGGMNTDGLIRVYCIGWQSTVKGSNVKSLTWVYPAGVIENAEEPSMLDMFLALEEEKRQS